MLLLTPGGWDPIVVNDTLSIGRFDLNRVHYCAAPMRRKDECWFGLPGGKDVQVVVNRVRGRTTCDLQDDLAFIFAIG